MDEPKRLTQERSELVYATNCDQASKFSEQTNKTKQGNTYAINQGVIRRRLMKMGGHNIVTCLSLGTPRRVSEGLGMVAAATPETENPQES